MFWGQGYEPQTEVEGDDIEDDELQEGGGAIVAISSPCPDDGGGEDCGAALLGDGSSTVGQCYKPHLLRHKSF